MKQRLFRERKENHVTCLPLGFETELQCPWKDIQHHLQSRTPLVQTCEHGTPCRRALHRAQSNLSSPASCCTFLWKKHNIKHYHGDALFWIKKSSMLFSLFKDLPHLKHVLCHFWPPASRSSAAYTDFPHLGHFGFSGGLKGILA